MPEWAELRGKTGRRGLPRAGYRDLKSASDGAITPAGEAVRGPAHLVPPPASQAAVLPSCSTLTAAELPHAKKVLHLCLQGGFGHAQLLRFCRLWPSRLLCHAEVEIKPQLKPRGSVAKTDPKPSQLYMLQVKSTYKLGRLCFYAIYKRTVRAPTKVNELVLIAVGIGGKNTRQ